MKKTTRILALIAMMILSVGVYAQKPFAGVITFETSVEGTSDPNIQAQYADATTDYMVMGNSYRVEESEGVDVIQISNGNSKTVTVILGFQGLGKYYIQTTAEDLEKHMEKTELKFDYTGETKEIAGYKCQKVIVTSIDKETDEEDQVILHVAEIPGITDDINFSTFPGLKGYPLRTEQNREINGEDVKFVQTATAVTPNKKIKATSFLMPSDAKPISEAPAEVKAMLGMSDDSED